MSEDEDFLEASPSRLAALFERAPGFMFITRGPEHRFEFANKAGHDLVGNRKLIGLACREALPEIEAQGFPALLDEAFLTGEPFVGEDMPVWYLQPDGQHEKCYVQFLLQPIKEGDRVTGLFIEGYETTDRMEAVERAAALQTRLIHVSQASAMGTMAATLAHELNQPLSISANYLHGLKKLLERRDEASLERAREAADLALEATLRAGNVIKAVRSFMMKGSPVKQRLSARKVIGEACDIALICIKPTNMKVSIQVEDDAWLRADPTQIQQVLLNLIKNACEAMEGAATRRLTLSGERNSAGYRISVSDTGVGLEPATRDRLFEPFASTKSGGMGIGLSICRTIVEAHDGRLWWEENPAGGTRFCFLLPEAGA